jgi:hypothetical protein
VGDRSRLVDRPSIASSWARNRSGDGCDLRQRVVERAQRLVRRRRTDDERQVEIEEVRRALAGQSRVAKGLPSRLRPLRIAATRVGDAVPQSGPHVNQLGVSSCRLEQQERGRSVSLDLLDPALACEHALERGDDASGRLTWASPAASARSAAPSAIAAACCGVGCALASPAPAQPRPRGRQQLDRALQHGRGGEVVAAPERAATGGGEPLARLLGEGRVRPTEQRSCSELPARGGDHELVQFDEVRALLFAPAREPLVEVGPKAFGIAS